MKVNDMLKKLRAVRNLSQNDMAEILGVSLSSYQKYEREKNSITPSLEVLLRVADFYDVSLDYLLGRETREQDGIDELASEFNMSALEQKILTNYLALPENMRSDLMGFLDKSVKEVMQEDG